MGVVRKQSIQNVLITYLGFFFGAINTVFLYTKILPDRYYGLVTFILAAAALLMPVMSFGVHNTLVKFYSGYTDPQKKGFLSLMLVLPLLGIFPLALVLLLWEGAIENWVSQVNAMVGNYLWYIFFIGLAMGYFEVFYAWCKVRLKSVLGNFMKEVFARIGVFILLILFHFELISLDFFFKALVGLYLLRTLLIALFALRLERPGLPPSVPGNIGDILSYSLLIIMGGSSALILLEIDKVMLNQFISIENIAYYGVAVYIATVIIVPSRSMHQITYPLTAELMNSGNHSALENLYKRSSLTLLIASGLLFILIILNLEDLYLMLPKAYRDGYAIVFLIGLAKVIDSLLGNNNSILYNSPYYKTVLAFGVGLAVLTIGLNYWLIPRMGLLGAALASFVSIFIFNLIKLVFVRIKFSIHPFGPATYKVLALLVALGLVFQFIPFGLHPLANIVLKSALVSVLFLGALYRFGLSEDVSTLLERYLKK